MEGELSARDRVGVQDFVLLENFTSEDAFNDNLEKRFKENLIYVSLSLSLLCLIVSLSAIPFNGRAGGEVINIYTEPADI